MNAKRTDSTYGTDGRSARLFVFRAASGSPTRSDTAVGLLRVLATVSVCMLLCFDHVRASDVPESHVGFEYAGRAPNGRGGIVEFLLSAVHRRSADGGGWTIREGVQELSGSRGRVVDWRISCEGRLSEALNVQSLRWDESSADGVSRKVSVDRLGDRLVVNSGTSPSVELASAEPTVATLAGLVLLASISGPSGRFREIRTLSMPVCHLSRSPMEWNRTPAARGLRDTFTLPDDTIDIFTEAGVVTEIRMKSNGWMLRPIASRSTPLIPPVPDIDFRPSSRVDALAGVEFFSRQGDRTQLRALVLGKQVMDATNRRGLVQIQREDEVIDGLVSSRSRAEKLAPELAWLEAVSAATLGRERLAGSFVDLGDGLLMQAKLDGRSWHVVDVFWMEESALEVSIPPWSAVTAVQRMALARSLASWDLFDSCID